MEALVFLWDFPLIMDSIKTYKNKYYRVIVVDKAKRMPECILSHRIIEETFDEVIVAEDITDKEELNSIIREILKKHYIKAIYGTFEASVEMAGYLRDKFHIQGIGEEQAITVRNKYVMKQCVKNTDIRVAQVEKIKSADDIKAFIQDIGYPIVIKPIDGAGTVNTYKISNDSQLEDFLKKEDIAVTIKEGTYIVEEFISGEEYHVDSVVVNGKVEFDSIGKYLYNCIDTINTTSALGSIIFPSVCKDNVLLDRIREVNSKVVRCLNILNSICHMEVFVQEDGTIVFSEIAVRVGGGPLIGTCIRNSYGVDIYKGFLEVELGEYAQEKLDTKIYSGFVAFPTKKGIITKISTLEEYKEYPGLLSIKLFNKVGDQVHAKDNTADRTGYIILQSDNYDELKSLLEKAYCDFTLEVE